MKLTVFGQLTQARRTDRAPKATSAWEWPTRQWAMECTITERKEQEMPLMSLVVTLIIVGVGLYLINQHIPMASSIKTILNVVVVVVVCVWLLQAFGVMGSMSSFRIG